MPELGQFIVMEGAEATDDAFDGVHYKMWHGLTEAERNAGSSGFDIADSLCDACKKLLAADWWTNVLLHKTQADLLESSRTCHCCLVFYQSLRVKAAENGRVDELESHANDPDAWVWGLAKYWRRLDEENAVNRNWYMKGIEVSIQKGPETPPPRFELGFHAHPEYPWVSLETDVLPNDTAELLLEAVGREDMSTGSETRLSLARHWLDSCAEHHKMCTALQRNPVRLPSRVIDVGSSDGTEQPLLHESRGEVGTYLCLSHRWGGSKVITTTLRTLEERKSRIPFGEMPNTFQDAITITRLLGFRYIWIDSLCIVQDHLGDWENEARAMGRIYKASTLTLAAAMATSADTGLFFPYDGRLNRPCYLASVRRQPSTAEARVFVKQYRPQEKGRHNHSFCPKGPLATRGWVLQEEVLSPRILSFAADGLYWECTLVDAAEFVPESVVPKKKSTTSILYARTFKEILFESALARYIPTRRPPHPGDIKDTWDALIENFSARDLTHESDTLIALQGVVEVFKGVTGDTFVAGLWKRHFLQQLMWHVDPGEVAIEWKQVAPSLNMKEPKHIVLPPRLTGPHRRSIRAPSWSWACVRHQVSWRFTGLTRALMKVLEVDAREYGAGEWEGRLRVRGVLRAAVARAGNRTKRDKLADPKDEKNVSHWYFCDEIDWEDERVMRLGIAEHLGWTHCLALYPTENCSLINQKSEEMEFRRVGFAIWDTKVWRQFLGPEDDGYSHLREKVKSFQPPATVFHIV